MKLYLTIVNAGDGSNYPNFTLEKEAIDELERLYEEGDNDGWGVDGDGFTYTEINVPDDSTKETLGISLFTLEEVKSWFSE